MLAVKLIGAALIIIAATLVGINTSNNLKQRVEVLNWYLRSVNIISDRIRYTALELEKIIKELPNVQTYINIYYPFKITAQNSALHNEDKALIDEFFDRLGGGDKRSQTDICSMYAKELEARLHQAQKEYSEKSKPIKSLGFFAGLGIAIIFI